ncbi:MAG TPA: S-methyl-5-thioribose-1-phosphate isomerase [Phycisphaerae bacterium]|nr:S-methyl-5-thioribose-1-phosphate isomerase [Phycisphaerae bacterium]HPU25369.1 S-methyl-5-thioribose-1-phosphate isomerase [Phycisphaerae bacterium]
MVKPIRYKTIEWVGGLDGQLRLIDQTLLPGECRVVTCEEIEPLWEAIRNLRVRGAPAIGVATAYGVVLGIRKAPTTATLFEKLGEACDYLSRCRPTAVNLFWALDRMKRVAESVRMMPVDAIKARLLAEAQAIRDEDAATCWAIGQAGQHLIQEGAGVLTHCNAGGLATAEYGTALAIMYAAREAGRRFLVYADETRPLLQGARLTAWELAQAGIDVTVICDNMAGLLMRQGKVSLVVTGADRIARNGDTANKIGTYSVAVLARAHNVPFYVAAPLSTFDLATADGTAIPIEERPADEISKGFGRVTVPEGVACYNPAFDVTPANLIEGIITEKGIIRPVTQEVIEQFFQDGTCKAKEKG